ncbi:hypothetical protein [Streptomyces sp. NPDC088261]|uniref:hypothetical protein n=1 Tax=Streptomyces sp. NPDC088261 TaxID=3365851 RepID=UPI00382BE0CD
MSAPDEVVTVWTEHSRSATISEHLLADGRVSVWVEPPAGEPLHPGDDDLDSNPICECPRLPRQFCMACAGCAVCGHCASPHVWPPLRD